MVPISRDLGRSHGISRLHRTNLRNYLSAVIRPDGRRLAFGSQIQPGSEHAGEAEHLRSGALLHLRPDLHVASGDDHGRAEHADADQQAECRCLDGAESAR